MKPYAKKSRGKTFGNKSKGRNEYGEKNRTRPNSYDATCAKCGSNCQVPFKPNGKKPVHCSRCFDKFGPSASIGTEGGSNRSHSVPADNAEVVRQLKVLNDKFDVLFDALEEMGME